MPTISAARDPLIIVLKELHDEECRLLKTIRKLRKAVAVKGDPPRPPRRFSPPQ